MCCFQWDYRDACMATAGTLGCSLDFWHSLAVKKKKNNRKHPSPQWLALILKLLKLEIDANEEFSSSLPFLFQVPQESPN